MAWVTADLSKSGIMGDAPAGNAEKGERWLDQLSSAYATSITEVANSARRELGLL
jgi:creatinine amidohydrolase